jgi:hypothetical protein
MYQFMFLKGVISNVISIPSIDHAHVVNNYWIQLAKHLCQHLNSYTRSFHEYTYLIVNL